MDTDEMIKNGIHAAILIGLVFVLLFLLSFTGVVKCSQLPVVGEAWCDVYWMVIGQPKVLIVYGDYGLGNPIGVGNGSLEEILSDPAIIGVYPDTISIDRVNLGNLRDYDMVIVERARKIETKQLRAFIDYATQPTGGILVWTGDAGLELGPKDSYLYSTDRNPDDDYNGIIGPWARRDGDYMVLFDELLGVRPVDTTRDTYCKIFNCAENGTTYAGNLETEPSGDHPLIRGISRTLPLYVFKNQDFTVVETLSGSITLEALSLDFGGKPAMQGHDLNRSVPLIVTSGIGERVIYYALPPEQYANPRLKEFGKDQYLLPIENLYYGSLKG